MIAVVAEKLIGLLVLTVTKRSIGKQDRNRASHKARMSSLKTSKEDDQIKTWPVISESVLSNSFRILAKEKASFSLKKIGKS